MLILPIEEAEPGMKLAAPVLHPENPEQQLLRAGFVLEPAIIGRMKDLHIAFIYVDYPSLDHLDKHLSVYLSPARQEVLRQIKQAIGSVQTQAKPRISYSDYANTTRELIKTLMEQGKTPIYMDQMSRLGSDAVAHAGAVAHLSLLLGLKSEQYLVAQRARLSPQRARDIVNLGVAGMLHDVGLMKLPAALRGYTELEPPASEQDNAEWQHHSRLGYETIHGAVEPTAAAAVLQHHQHFDGSGFPGTGVAETLNACLEGQRIHVFARIILCANLYDRLASPVKGHRRPNVEILELMRTTYASWIDPEVFKVLQQVVPPFVPGSRVKLTDGSRAIVMDVDPTDPYHPTVRLLAPGSLTLLDTSINLKQAGTPQIARPANTAKSAA